MKNNKIYVIEVNPRASRTIPFISKIKDIPYAKYAAQVSVGKKLSELDFIEKNTNLIAVKKPVFPFNKFPDQNIFLSPDMKSTGEVIGFDKHLGSAYAKASYGAGEKIPLSGNVFISVNDSDKENILKISRDLDEMNYNILATKGTAELLSENGINCNQVYKVGEGRPNIVDLMISNEIDLVINTVEGLKSIEDSFSLRQTALLNNIPYYTTIQGAIAVTSAIKSVINKKIDVHSLQSYLNWLEFFNGKSTFYNRWVRKFKEWI